MNVAKYLLLVLLALPVMELAAFVAVSAQIGSLAALALLGLTSLAGLAVLRFASDRHADRIWMALGDGNVKALRADGRAGLTLLAGFLLLIPGFITDALGLLLLAGHALGAALRRGEPASADGVVDLPPEDWRRVPDPELPDRRGGDERR
jgi:UPF0716 protein FxsA